MYKDDFWKRIRFMHKPACGDQCYTIEAEAIERPAGLQQNIANLDALRQLTPPQQAGSFPWRARICYWTPEDLCRLYNSEVPPTFVYKNGSAGRSGHTSWQQLMQLLQQQSEFSPDRNLVGRGSAEPAAAAAPAAAADGVLRNVLLLHVAGRHNDSSIKMLLVPKVDIEATEREDPAVTRYLLYAYFLVLPRPSFEDKMLMYHHEHMSPVKLDAAFKGLKGGRTTERAWQACIDYAREYAARENGLPGYTAGSVTLSPHLDSAAPHGQLDWVDRCYIQRREQDTTAALHALRGSFGGGDCIPSSSSNSGSSEQDACAAAGIASAGALQLLPLRVGARSRFEAVCGCPPGLWCGGAARRKQLVQLWSGEYCPQLHVKPCANGTGLGLFARQDFPAGSLVGEYSGELVTVKEVQRREAAYLGSMKPLNYLWIEHKDNALPPELVLSMALAGQKHGHCGGRPNKVQARQQSEQLAIDATWLGGVTRFANHSCAPNCRMVLVCNGRGEEDMPLLFVLMETLQDVVAGEELTFDYSPPPDGKAHCKPRKGLVDCCCGAPECRGLVFADWTQC